MRVGSTRVMLDSVIASFCQGDSAEAIREQYPALSLADVYGAIAFYLSNRQEVDDYLRRQKDIWIKEREKAEAISGPLIQRLRAIGRGEM